MNSARQAVQDKIKKLGRKPHTSKSWNEWKRKQKKIKKLGRKPHTVKSWTEWRKKQKEKFPLW